MKNAFFRKSLIAVGAIFCLLIAGTAYATSEDKAQYVVKVDEVASKNIYKAAQTVDVRGTINGDLIVAAQTVNVSGTVTGDVIAAASDVQITGDVQGNVRVAASSVLIGGTVGKNVNAFGATVTFSEDSTVGWSVLSSAASVTLNGAIGGNAEANGATVALNGTVGGDVTTRVDPDGTVTLGESTYVGGDLQYTGSAPVVDADATVAGELVLLSSSVTDIQFDSNTFLTALGKFVAFFKSVSLVAMVLVALFLVGFFKDATLSVVHRVHEEPGRSFGWGLAVFFITPVIVAFLAVTLVGIPLAAILGAIYGIKLYLAKVLLGVIVGYWMMTKLAKKNEADVNAYLTATLGVVLVGLIMFIPVLGGILGFVGILWVLGAMWILTKQKLRL